MLPVRRHKCSFFYLRISVFRFISKKDVRSIKFYNIFNNCLRIVLCTRDAGDNSLNHSSLSPLFTS